MSEKTTDPGRRVRVIGNQRPAYVRGHRRSFWSDAMARRVTPVIEFPSGPMFDVSEIIANLEYRGVTGAQAA